jgi:hypothetical protein
VVAWNITRVLVVFLGVTGGWKHANRLCDGLLVDMVVDPKQLWALKFAGIGVLAWTLAFLSNPSAYTQFQR